jgi:3-hydroxybutyrate dehydrogenase
MDGSIIFRPHLQEAPMLKGKNAIITGSTSGIGNAIAHSLAAEGCNILLNGIADKQTVDGIIKELQDKYKVQADYSPADMTKPKEIADMVAMCDRVFGSTDILVNNAGIQHTAPLDEFPDDKWDAIIAINLSASFHSIKAALPGMKKRDFGRIINIASVHGLVASTHKAAYVAAKHGIVGLTKVTALENAPANITCNAICPGWVHTPLVQKQIEDKAKAHNCSVEEATNKLLGEKQPNRKFVHAEQIGAMIVFLCGENGTAMTGEMITIDGGWTAQ